MELIFIFWVNYNISPTWIKAIWGWFPLLTMIPVRSQWGRYNLPIYIYIYTHTYWLVQNQDTTFTDSGIPHDIIPQLIINQQQPTGWCCSNQLEKWWSSSMGRMTSLFLMEKHVWNHQQPIIRELYRSKLKKGCCDLPFAQLLQLSMAVAGWDRGLLKSIPLNCCMGHYIILLSYYIN